MPKPETIDAVIAYVRFYLDAPNAPLTLDSCLSEQFSAHDPDAFSDFLCDAAKKFGVQAPAVDDWAAYRAKMRELRGLSLADLFPPDWQGTPTVYVDKLSLGRLCEIVEAGMWPSDWIYPDAD